MTAAITQRVPWTVTRRQPWVFLGLVATAVWLVLRTVVVVVWWVLRFAFRFVLVVLAINAIAALLANNRR